jgi:hypothetical protein
MRMRTPFALSKDEKARGYNHLQCQPPHSIVICPVEGRLLQLRSGLLAEFKNTVDFFKNYQNLMGSVGSKFKNY